jgi:hypothetical protein
MSTISIKGLDKARVLKVLYENAQVQGMGIFQVKGSELTLQECSDLLNNRTRFDYLYGRVMKIDLSKDEFETALYNRDNGDGAAERVIEAMIETNKYAKRVKSVTDAILAKGGVLSPEQSKAFLARTLLADPALGEEEESEVILITNVGQLIDKLVSLAGLQETINCLEKLVNKYDTEKANEEGE